VTLTWPERYRDERLQAVRILCSLHDGFVAIAMLGLLSGTVGVTGLIVGCTMMVRETRLAVDSLAEEAQLAIDPN
jgi:hypothetical protein